MPRDPDAGAGARRRGLGDQAEAAPAQIPASDELRIRVEAAEEAFEVQARLVERSSRIATKALILLKDVRDMAELDALPPPPDHEDDRHEDLGDQPAKPKPAPARRPRRVLEPSK